MIHRSRRRHRKLPLPASFKVEQREHWLDRHEREAEERDAMLRNRALDTNEAGRLNNSDGDDLDRT